MSDYELLKNLILSEAPLLVGVKAVRFGPWIENIPEILNELRENKQSKFYGMGMVHGTTTFEEIINYVAKEKLKDVGT